MTLAAPASTMDKTEGNTLESRVSPLVPGMLSDSDISLPARARGEGAPILEMMPHRITRGLMLGTVNATWLQHEAFRQLVEDWRRENAPAGQLKAALDPIAEALEVSVGYLRQILLPNSKKNPSPGFKIAACAFFGVPLGTLLDEKHSELPGIPHPEKLSATKRLAAQRILAALNDPDLPDDAAIDIANYLRNTVEFSIRVKHRLG